MTSYDDVLKAHEMHDKAIEDELQANIDLANAEYEYDIISAAAIKVEKDNGTPVTIMVKTINGTEKVASAKKRVNLCKAFSKAASSRVQHTYNCLKETQEYEKRDWMQGGYGDYGA